MTTDKIKAEEITTDKLIPPQYSSNWYSAIIAKTVYITINH